jgi:hypothetical protein
MDAVVDLGVCGSDVESPSHSVMWLYFICPTLLIGVWLLSYTLIFSFVLKSDYSCYR